MAFSQGTQIMKLRPRHFFPTGFPTLGIWLFYMIFGLLIAGIVFEDAVTRCLFIAPWMPNKSTRRLTEVDFHELPEGRSLFLLW